MLTYEQWSIRNIIAARVTCQRPEVIMAIVSANHQRLISCSHRAHIGGKEYSMGRCLLWMRRFQPVMARC